MSSKINISNTGISTDKISYTNIHDFDVMIPLSLIFGFADDYTKIIVNAKHELILIRGNNDLPAVTQTELATSTAQKKNFENIKITLSTLEWIVPYVNPSDQGRIQLLQYIKKDPSIFIPFRSWDFFKYPVLP